MITEDYVSFETAKLLKEKGFDEYCPVWYNLDKPSDGPFFYKQIGWYGHNSYDYNGRNIISAPTLQMAMKWLREVHHLEIYLEHDAIQECNNWWYRIGNFGKECISILHESDSIYTSYEEACEAAIKYCLENLI